MSRPPAQLDTPMGGTKLVLVATPLKTLMLKSLKNLRFEYEFP